MIQVSDPQRTIYKMLSKLLKPMCNSKKANINTYVKTQLQHLKYKPTKVLGLETNIFGLEMMMKGGLKFLIFKFH